MHCSMFAFEEEGQFPFWDDMVSRIHFFKTEDGMETPKVEFVKFI